MSACVQCGGKYLDDDSCAFHLSNDSNRSGQYNCCGKSTGCVLNKPHSLVHHCKFPYAKFLPYARGITGYTDTTDEFAEVKLTNLEDNTSEFASVSQLLRYVSKGSYVKDQNLLLVRVGNVWPTNPYFFHVFAEADLDAAARAGTALIFRTSAKTDQYAQASWIFKDQIICGVRLECKVACFTVPTIKDVFFSQFPLKKDSVKVISQGGIVEKRAQDHGDPALPGISYNSPVVPDLSKIREKIRAPRTDFPTIDLVTNQKELDISSDAKILVNQDRVFEGEDNFSFAFTLLNSGEKTTHMFKQLKLEFKLLNQKDWKVVDADKISFHGKFFPATVAPFQSLPERAPFYRSVLARHTPARFRISFLDTKERSVSIVQEFVQPISSRLEEKKDTDELFLFVDDVASIERYSVHLRAPKEGDEILSGDVSLNINQARKLVHEANKSGVTEVKLEQQLNKDSYTATFFALIDLNLQRVYAIKVWLTLKSNNLTAQGYARLRCYAEPDAPIGLTASALETNVMPKLTAALPDVDSLFLFEDKKVDDVVLAPQGAVASASASAASASGGVTVNLEGIEAQLRALNENVARTAAALEALVKIKQSKNKKWNQQ